MLRLKIIACDIFNREISYLASQSKCMVNVTFLHQGLHDTPEKLTEMIQAEIDKTNLGFPYNYYNTAPHYDYIIIGYGLCSNGVVGLTSKHIPIIIPRAHDCITLLLGSKETYGHHFSANPGTYWFSAGWVERGWQPSKKKYEALLQEYTEKYGEENAEFLMEMEQKWMKDYNQAALISWDCIGNNQAARDFTMQSASYLKWTFKEIKGDPGLLQKILNGEFRDDEVLVVPPNKKVIQSYTDGILGFE